MAEGDIKGVKEEAGGTYQEVTLNSEFETPLNADQKRKITYGTADPTGGADGDIYLQYTA